MAKEATKRAKSVKKVTKAVRKVVDKGVNAEVVSAAVDDAITTSTGEAIIAADKSVPTSPAKTRKLPGLRKYNNIVSRPVGANDIQAQVVGRYHAT